MFLISTASTSGLLGLSWRLCCVIPMVRVWHHCGRNLYANEMLAHPIQVGWTSRNSNTVRSRTVSAALYNMSVQTSGIISSNIYREDDAPLYRRGNRQLLVILIVNIFLYLLTKAYYIWRNDRRDQIWSAMSEEQRKRYVIETTDEGSKRLDFRFAH